MQGNDDDNEVNIEGIAGDHAARYPLDDPDACWELHRQTGELVQLHLANRAARQARLRQEQLETDRVEL
jgi:hypothetical protein